MAIIVILIAGLLFMIKFFKIKIMEPAGLYSIMWIVFIVGSILFLREEYDFKYSGISWILVSCYIFIIVSRVVWSKKKMQFIHYLKNQLYLGKYLWLL